MEAMASLQPSRQFIGVAIAPSKTYRQASLGSFPKFCCTRSRVSLQVAFHRLDRLSPRLSLMVMKSFVVRASANDEDNAKPSAPFKPESPTGQFLTELLQSHPHLVPAAVELELEKLAERSDSKEGQDKISSTGSELVLYKRIGELKAQERRRALEEIIYTLIAQKFVEAGVSMLPNISYLTSLEKSWPFHKKELESVHSLEVLEMISQHLILVLGPGGGFEYYDQNTYARISKVRVGQVYAVSILYGYFLRRIYQRYRLEKSMKMLQPRVDDSIAKESDLASQRNIDTSSTPRIILQGFSGHGVVPPSNVKPTKLQSYIMAFDMDTLQNFASLRSKESLGVLEKHTEALFGRPEIHIAPDGSMAVKNDEELRISFGGLKGLLLEAIAFGSFLWDVESYADSSLQLCH